MTCGSGSKTCCPGANAERFGEGTKIHTRVSRWAKSGVWERVFQHLTADADNEYTMIDSTVVRVHQHSAGAKKGR